MITVLGKPLRGPTPLTRLVLLALLSAALMLLDHRGQHLQGIRARLAVLVYPVQVVAELPIRFYHGVVDIFRSEASLRAERDRLLAERELHLARLQQFESVEAENARLRSLLDSSARVSARAVAADLVEVSLEPFSRRLLIRRGEQDKVYLGQPVIDAHGIVGQVTRVASNLSTVTLITDPGHAVPVINQRSGVRTLVFGSGERDGLSIPYLNKLADIQEGDVLVSSGMGGTFPADYPVAVVTRVVNDPNEGFLIVNARPAAQLEYGKQVMLIWPGQAVAAGTTSPTVSAKGKKP
jgi:rod shape-determining protein MreC